MQTMRQSVAAAELVRNFAHWREVGAREPVTITHHGRQTHIFMGIDSFQTLASSEGASRPGQDRTRDLANRIHQGLILCRADLAIDFANDVALSMTRRWDRRIEGQSLWEALPELAGTLTEAHIRHSLASGETSAADIPSPFRHDSWLHLETFPFADGIALLLRDITAEMQRHRLADVKVAILKAMGVHEGVGYARLSNRGFLEVVDNSFCAMIGLPEDRLLGVPLPDLIALPARPALRADMERVLRGEEDCKIMTRFLTNGGSVFTADAALARLRGAYGNEGAVMVVTAAKQPNLVAETDGRVIPRPQSL